MIPPLHNLIQIAGIIDHQEAQMLTDCGVEYLGFPLRLPVNDVDISELDASKIIAALDYPVKAVAITYQDDAKEIQDLMTFLGADIVQLHGDIPINQIAELKRLCPELKVIKSLVIGKHSRDYLNGMVRKFESAVDAFITDTYDPDSGASGATGKTHDWEISRQIVELSQRPVILAGGLNAGNVRQAIRAVRPAGVDVHTGVEAASGRKDRCKVNAFLAEAKVAFSMLKT